MVYSIMYMILIVRLPLYAHSDYICTLTCNAHSDIYTHHTDKLACFVRFFVLACKLHAWRSNLDIDLTRELA